MARSGLARFTCSARTSRAGLAVALGGALLAAGCASTDIDRPKLAETVIRGTEANCNYVPDLSAVLALLKSSGARSPDALVVTICRAVGQVPPEQAAAASRSLTVVVNGKKIPGRMAD